MGDGGGVALQVGSITYAMILGSFWLCFPICSTEVPARVQKVSLCHGQED